jgi:hypothetical protein
MDIGTLINNHVSKLDKVDRRVYERKTNELCHLAKLLLSINEGYFISVVREAPDFIIQNEFGNVCIEHTILVNNTKKQFEGSLNDIFYHAQTEFKKLYPEKKYLVNIYLKPNIPEINKSQTKRLTTEINNIIYEWITSKTLIPNDFIDHIFYMPHDKLDFEPNTGTWDSGFLTKDHFTKAVTKKESNILSYVTNTNIQEQWLLIVIGSMGKSAFQINTEIDLQIPSKFSRIYILEDFYSKVHRIK